MKVNIDDKQYHFLLAAIEAHAAEQERNPGSEHTWVTDKDALFVELTKFVRDFQKDTTSPVTESVSAITLSNDALEYVVHKAMETARTLGVLGPGVDVNRVNETVATMLSFCPKDKRWEVVDVPSKSVRAYADD